MCVECQQRGLRVLAWMACRSMSCAYGSSLRAPQSDLTFSTRSRSILSSVWGVRDPTEDSACRESRETFEGFGSCDECSCLRWRRHSHVGCEAELPRDAEAR